MGWDIHIRVNDTEIWNKKASRSNESRRNEQFILNQSQAVDFSRQPYTPEFLLKGKRNIF